MEKDRFGRRGCQTTPSPHHRMDTGKGVTTDQSLLSLSSKAQSQAPHLSTVTVLALISFLYPYCPSLQLKADTVPTSGQETPDVTVFPPKTDRPVIVNAVSEARAEVFPGFLSAPPAQRVSGGEELRKMTLNLWLGRGRRFKRG